MENKKLTLPLLLILALSMIGLAYAHWSENLFVSGTVETGELDWGFTAASCLDEIGLDRHCNDGFEGQNFWIDDKDVGSTSVDFDIADPHTISVTLDNVYPCYFTSVSVYAHAKGTIPIIFEAVIINDVVTLTESLTPIVGLDLNNDLKNDIEIWWKNGFGEQRHPGLGEFSCFEEMSFWIHVLQNAPENTPLEFTITLVAVQYNEYVAP